MVSESEVEDLILRELESSPHKAISVPDIARKHGIPVDIVLKALGALKAAQKAQNRACPSRNETYL